MLDVAEHPRGRGEGAGFHLLPEYPRFRRDGIDDNKIADKVIVHGVNKKDAPTAVHFVMTLITSKLGHGFVEHSVGACEKNGRFNVYLRAYGLSNALAVANLFTSENILAFGPHRLLRWCERCQVRGHNRRECKLPTVMIRSRGNLNQNTVELIEEETKALCGFMGSNPLSVNTYNKKFAFFLFPDDKALTRAAPTFVAFHRLGAFQARPRCFMGLPKMCGACGLLKDEASPEEWHQAGDARCKRHKFVPCARGRSTQMEPKPAGTTLMNRMETEEKVQELLDKLRVSNHSTPPPP
jgi:hypothetical protein